jgi:carboxyl-terminal processing protease
VTSPSDPPSLDRPELDPVIPPRAGTQERARSRDGIAITLAAVLVSTLAGIAVFMAGLSLGSQGVGRDADEQAAIEAFVETYRRINEDYIGESERGELLEGAIEGMFETLDDPYSAYLAPDEFETTFADISGEFEGIGARMAIETAEGVSCELVDDRCALRVIEVLPDSPALAAGLQRDDVVTAVDGRGLAGRTIEDAVELIRGPRDSEVTVSLDRAGSALELAIRRDVIVSDDVRTALMADGQVGYLRIDAFSASVAEAFETALHDHLEAGIRRLVLDVRHDPGGFVDAAVDITSQFVSDGPVYWEESADGRQRSVEVTGDGLAHDADVEIVVLIDDGTASASEILAGALQDSGRARLVGEPSFGKGTVQEWTRLPGQSGGFRLSVAKWLTRDKAWVHETGLRPDVEVIGEGTDYWPEVDGAVADEAAVAADPQLASAIEILLGDPAESLLSGASASPGI